jgi:8-oxo-dGTP pyrophosphatase MutT (NUDIX family)
VSEERQNHCGDRTVFSRDLDDEGEPEAEFHPGIARRLPRKNVASGALIRDDAGRVLFVSPTYKPFLEIPGGLTEDDESPQAGCQREIHEELGIRVAVGKLLLIDWMPTHGVWQDSIQMIFDGGVLSPEQVDRIHLGTDELHGFEFVELNAAKARLRPSKARRVQLAYQALLDGETAYGEFGRTVHRS